MKETDLLSIKEFSALTGVRQSTLRHYDEVKLFRPVRRGENGYRYYSAPQTIAIHFIRVLSSLDVPLKKIGEIQTDRTPERMLELLRRQELELNRQLLHLQRAYALILTYGDMIREGLNADEQALSVRRMEELPVVMGPPNDFSSGSFYDSFFNFIGQMADRKMDAAHPIGGYYESMDAFGSVPGKPGRFFSITPAGRESKAAGEYLVGYARGYYGSLGDLPGRMKAHAEENGLVFAGPVYEMYLHDEISVTEPERYLIQVSAALGRR
ncbi:MAG: MerR family DNA-binding transcriptional regulator [Oscillospiraceae bacterium]|nr:MerR family DNA-binding transcriptional regulator [Oscillospiraceae bacterium]